MVAAQITSRQASNLVSKPTTTFRESPLAHLGFTAPANGATGCSLGERQNPSWIPSLTGVPTGHRACDSFKLIARSRCAFVPDRRPETQRQLWLWMSPRYRLRGGDEIKARLHWTGTRPVRDGHLRPVIRTDDFSVDYQGSPEILESLTPIPQGLTWFLSRFHVRQHGEKPAVFFACAEDTSQRERIIFRKYDACQALFFRTCRSLDYHRPKEATNS